MQIKLANEKMFKSRNRTNRQIHDQIINKNIRTYELSVAFN